MQRFIGLTVRTVALIAIWRNVSELFDVSGSSRPQLRGCHALLALAAMAFLDHAGKALVPHDLAFTLSFSLGFPWVSVSQTLCCQCAFSH
jgi:hypothetical protein